MTTTAPSRTLMVEDEGQCKASLAELEDAFHSYLVDRPQTGDNYLRHVLLAYMHGVAEDDIRAAVRAKTVRCFDSVIDAALSRLKWEPCPSLESTRHPASMKARLDETHSVIIHGHYNDTFTLTFQAYFTHEPSNTCVVAHDLKRTMNNKCKTLAVKKVFSAAYREGMRRLLGQCFMLKDVLGPGLPGIEVNSAPPVSAMNPLIDLSDSRHMVLLRKRLGRPNTVKLATAGFMTPSYLQAIT